MVGKAVERVARALCVHGGKDPDALVKTSNPIAFYDNGGVTISPELVPAWKSFVSEAERFIAASQALNKD